MKLADCVYDATLFRGMVMSPNFAIPEGRAIRTTMFPGVIYMHPRDYCGLQIEIEPGLTYAERSAMHGRMRHEYRRQSLGRRRGVPTFDELIAGLQRAAEKDGKR